LKLQKLHYENFRNHHALTFEPSEGINLIYGLNGSGKTSVLEGIHYCALTKGFVNSADSECLMFDHDFFLLEGTFLSVQEHSTSVKVAYTKEKEKSVTVNNVDIKPFSQHIGRLPCITFTPSELIIVTGSPSERRRFLDTAISQTNRRYLEDLLAYRKVLQQRNALLLQLRDRQMLHHEMLPLWTEMLARLAASIVFIRLEFLTAFSQPFHEVAQHFSRAEYPSIFYRSAFGKMSDTFTLDTLYDIFIMKYEEVQRVEILRAQTMVGPHRDDLIFLLNDKEIKKYASQGQLRTFLITLKLAEHRFFSELLGESPLCLLDDIFSELDINRVKDIFTLLESCGQSIITSTEERPAKNVSSFAIEMLKN